MKKTISVVQYDNVCSVRVGRYTETFTTDHLTRYEIIDRVRWILITAGVSMDEDRVREILHELGRDR